MHSLPPALRKTLLLLLALGAACALRAVPIVGANVYVASSGNVTAKYLGNSAAYSNDLYLDRGSDPDLFIFNNHTSSIGSTVDLGFFTAGTELIFRLHVNNTGYDYFTGPGTRNPDGHAHARVDDEYSLTETRVEFEDLFNGPFNFNDLRFSFTNVSSTKPPLPPSVPDTAATSALLGAGLLALVCARRLLESASRT